MIIYTQTFCMITCSIFLFTEFPPGTNYNLFFYYVIHVYLDYHVGIQSCACLLVSFSVARFQIYIYVVKHISI